MIDIFPPHFDQVWIVFACCVVLTHNTCIVISHTWVWQAHFRFNLIWFAPSTLNHAGLDRNCHCAQFTLCTTKIWTTKTIVLITMSSVALTGFGISEKRTKTAERGIWLYGTYLNTVRSLKIEVTEVRATERRKVILKTWADLTKRDYREEQFLL